MKAASQQGAVAACAAPVRSIAGQPGCAGRGSWLSLCSAGEASEAAGHLRGQHYRAAAAGCPRPEGGWEPGLGLPDRGQAGSGSCRGSSLPPGCRRVRSERGSADRGRTPGPVGGGRGEEVAVAPVRSCPVRSV